MNILEFLSSFPESWSEVSRRWVLTMGHFLWQGTIVGAVAALALRALRRASAEARYRLALFALLSLAGCMPLTYCCLSDSRSSATLVSRQPSTKPAIPSVDAQAGNVISDLHTVGPSPPSPQVADSAPAPSATHHENFAREWFLSTFDSLFPGAITLLYACGVALLLLRTARAASSGLSLRAEARPVADARTLVLIRRQARAVGLRAAPLVAYCARVSTPTVVGILSPIVLLPTALVTGLEPVQLAAILRHELAHIRRYDPLVNLLQRLVESLLFFHPVVWWISRRVSIEREHCCDDLATTEGTRVQYVEALLRMAELCAEVSPSAGFSSRATALSATGNGTSEFGRRIRRLLDLPEVPRIGIGYSRAASLALGLALLTTSASLLGLAQVSERHERDDHSVSTDVTNESENNESDRSGREDSAPEDSASKTATRDWKAVLIDGTTGKPVPGIKVRATVFVPGEDNPQTRELVSDERGAIATRIRDNQSVTAQIATLGWWRNFQVVAVVQPKQAAGGDDAVGEAKAVKPPTEIRIWPGQVVAGRLLYPDGAPAGGVLLNVGVYVNNLEWKKRIGMDLTWLTFDHGDWPNWSQRVVTEADGTFKTTVPPPDARWWLRVGTTGLGYGAINPKNIEAAGTGRALARCVPFEFQVGGRAGQVPGIPAPHLGAGEGDLNLGDLRLRAGVTVRGRVVDAEGNALQGVYLTTTGPHGPHSGRSAWSGDDGAFEFLPIAPGSLTIHPDARLRDERGQVVSRDVQAVFVDRSWNIDPSDDPVEILVQAVPHVDLKFRWRDHRADKSQPVSYYGRFIVNGFYELRSGQLVPWRGETRLLESDGQPWLAVKTPEALLDPALHLSRDRVVTAGYEDETGRSSGPGRVELGDINRPLERTIHGDEPKPDRRE